MGLENLMSRVKRGVIGRAAGILFGLAVAASPMYGCGDENPPCYENVCGIYNIAYNVVEEEPDDILLPEEETGEFELDVLRINQNKIKFGIFEPKEYDYDPNSGDITCKKWGVGGWYGETADYEVCGNVQKGHIDLDATVDIVYPENHPNYPEGRTEHIKYHLDGTKRTE